MKKCILPIVNFIVAFGCLIVLLFSNLSENVMYLMIMTIVVGWAMPYLVLLVTGVEFLAGLKHTRMTLVFNVLNVLICILDLYLTVRLFDKKMLVLVIEYSLMGLVSLVNALYLVVFIKKHPDMEKIDENSHIKKIKEKNNGAIV